MKPATTAQQSSLYLPIIGIWSLISIVILMLAQYYPPYNYGYNYYGVAYEMWTKHSFWYPIWHNLMSVQKPPLFYWLTHLIWGIFGINHIAMTVLVLLIYLLTAIYTAKTTLVFSSDTNAAKIAGILVLINLTFLKYIIYIRFDIQLTFCFILSAYALSKILYEDQFRYWWLYTLGGLLGLLFKGPVIFLFTLPAALGGLLILPTQRSIKSTQKRYLLYVLLFSLLSIALSAIWFIPANHQSHGLYWQTLFTQTLQRFDHTHPDPNAPLVVIKNYHWWHAALNTLSYLKSTLGTPFCLILPIFIVRLYYGIRQHENRRQILYFLLVFLFPTLMFGCFVGLIRARYLLPLVPWVCVFIATIGATIKTNMMTKAAQILEMRIYRLFLWVLGLGAIIIFFTQIWPHSKDDLYMRLQAPMAFVLIVVLGWQAKDFLQRWQRLIISAVLFNYFVLLMTIIILYPYATANTTGKKLQQISQQQLPVYEIYNYLSNTGWYQVLARQDLDIHYFSAEEFAKYSQDHKLHGWVIFDCPILKQPQFAGQLYPLVYTIKQKQVVPVLVSYNVYQRLTNQE